MTTKRTPKPVLVHLATLTWDQGTRGVYNTTGDEPIVIAHSPTDKRWHLVIENIDMGSFSTLRAAKDAAARKWGEITDPVKAGLELAAALGRLGATEESERAMATAKQLDAQRDRAVNNAKKRLANLQTAKKANDRAKKAGVDVKAVGREVANNKAAKAPAKKAPAKASGTRQSTGGEKNTHCPDCGYQFTTPKARCGSKEACAKRQADPTLQADRRVKVSGAKKAPAKKANGTKKAPAAKATASAKRTKTPRIVKKVERYSSIKPGVTVNGRKLAR